MLKLLTIPAFAVAMTAPTSATAATVLLGRFAGTIASGVDPTGAFGVAGSDMTGRRFTIRFGFEAATGDGVRTTDTTPDGDGETLDAYTSKPGGPPIFTPTLGVNFAKGGGFAAVKSSGVDYTSIATTGTPDGARLDFSSRDDAGWSIEIHTPPTAGLPFGIESRYKGSLCDAGCTAFVSYAGSAPIVLDIDRYDAIPLGVPEPATWALMIAGFGLTGATLRRRRALA